MISVDSRLFARIAAKIRAATSRKKALGAVNRRLYLTRASFGRLRGAQRHWRATLPLDLECRSPEPDRASCSLRDRKGSLNHDPIDADSLCGCVGK